MASGTITFEAWNADPRVSALAETPCMACGEPLSEGEYLFEFVGREMVFVHAGPCPGEGADDHPLNAIRDELDCTGL